MNCTYHIKNPVSAICIALHKCQRMLCMECLLEKGLDYHNPILIDKFVEQVKQLKASKLGVDISSLNEKRKAFKSILSNTQSQLKKMWENLQESINQIFDLIELQDSIYLQAVENVNPIELTFGDFEELVQIIQGKKIKEWNDERNSYLVMLERIKNGWEHYITTFIQKSNSAQNKIKCLINHKYKSYSRIRPFYVQEEDLSEIFDYVEDFDGSLFDVIIEKLKKENITDCIAYLTKPDTKQFYNVEKQSSNDENYAKFIPDILLNILVHDYSIKDYSEESYKKIRENLIKKISGNEKIIAFLKFLVRLTAIDEKFIKCGSNSLNLLVEMKADLSNQCWEDIRIKDTSLIGGTFVRCNLNGSEFDNVDLSGVNLNGAQLFNCKWKNIKIHELNKLDGHSSTVYSICFSPDGNTLASGSYDNSIRLWDINTGKQIEQTDTRYKDILAQFKTPLSQNNQFAEMNLNLNILLISQQAIFQAKGALILKGSFVNQSDIDLKTLFKQKGSCILEDFQKK